MSTNPTNASGSTSAQSDSDVLVLIYITDGDQSKEACFMKVTRLARDKATLEAIRTILVTKSEWKEFSSLKFCTKTGAVVADSYSVQAYLKDCSQSDNAASNSVTIYLKKNVEPELTAEAKVLGQYFDANRLALLKQAFDENAFKLLTGTAAKYTAELEEQEWSVISENNSLCYGMRVIRRKVDDKTIAIGVERARRPAFRLKRRDILSDKLTSISVKDVVMHLRIPDYEIDDQSYVTIYKTENQLQSSLADSSFSKFDVSAAASGSIFGCTLGVEASYSRSSDTQHDSASTESHKQVTIAYNFPRATVMLDQDSLDLTVECQDDLREVKDQTTLNEFLDKYGEFFSTRVQVGGRLFASEELDESTEKDTTKLVKSMKTAAAASFSGWGASASVKSAASNDTAQTTSEAKSNSASTLTWQANGGDTLLCNDPPQWCPTVAYHWNWRITKQDEVLHMVDLIGKFFGFRDLPKNMAEWKRAAEKSAGIAQKFKLTSGEKSLLCSNPSTKSLEDGMFMYNYDRDDEVFEASRYQKLLTRGLAWLGIPRSSGDQLQLIYEVETPDGGRVNPVCYETRYRLRNKASGRYIGHELCGLYKGVPLLCANMRKSSLLLFRAVDDSKEVKAISDGASLTVHFFDEDEDEKEFGFVAANGPSDGDWMALYVAKDGKGEKPAPWKVSLA